MIKEKLSTLCQREACSKSVRDSGVELAVPKTACCQFRQTARDSVCPMRRGDGVELLGQVRGVVLKYAPKQRLTHDFQLMTCVSSSGWLPLHALPRLEIGIM